MMLLHYPAPYQRGGNLNNQHENHTGHHRCKDVEWPYLLRKRPQQIHQHHQDDRFYDIFIGLFLDIHHSHLRQREELLLTEFNTKTDNILLHLSETTHDGKFLFLTAWKAIHDVALLQRGDNRCVIDQNLELS